MRFETRLVAVVAAWFVMVPGALPAGAQQVHRLPAHGLAVTYPTGWQVIPIQPGERWILAKFLADREHAFRNPTTGEVYNLRPMMVMLSFPKLKAPPKKATVVEQTESRTVIEIDGSDPYRDYADYTKRQYKGGGYFVSREDHLEIGAIPVTIQEITVEKLAAVPRRTLACIYQLPDQQIVTEVTIVDSQYAEVQAGLFRCLKSLAVIERDATKAAESKPSAGGRFWFLVGDKEFAKEQAARRKSWRDRVLKQVTQDLPKGWSAKNEKHLVVVGNAGAKYTEYVVWQAKEVRDWLEARFKDCGEGEVLRSILRVCSSDDVARAYLAGSGDAFIGETGEVVCAERGGFILGDFSLIADALLNQYLSDKNPALWWALPPWVTMGLSSHVRSARISKKVSGLVFPLPTSELVTCRQMVDQKRLIPLSDLVTKTGDDLGKGDTWQTEYRAEVVLFVRFLLDGPGAKGKSKGLIQNYMARSLEVLEARDKAQWKNLLEGKVTKEPLTEEEEEKEFVRRQKDAKKYQEEWNKQHREMLQSIAVTAFADWKPEDWTRLDAQFTSWIQAGLR